MSTPVTISPDEASYPASLTEKPTDVPAFALDDSGFGFGVILLAILLVAFVGGAGSFSKIAGLFGSDASAVTTQTARRGTSDTPTNISIGTSAPASPSSTGPNTPSVMVVNPDTQVPLPTSAAKPVRIVSTASAANTQQPPRSTGITLPQAQPGNTQIPGGISEPVTPAPPTWKRYTNVAYGFAFEYPASWELAEIAGQTPVAPEFTYFVLELTFNPSQPFSQTATLKINASDLAANSKVLDDAYALQSNIVSKSTALVNGRSALRYSEVTGGSGEVYLIDAGSRTFVFSSANESSNTGRLPAYWADFNRVLNSLTIQ